MRTDFPHSANAAIDASIEVVSAARRAYALSEQYRLIPDYEAYRNRWVDRGDLPEAGTPEQEPTAANPVALQDLPTVMAPGIIADAENEPEKALP